MARKAERDRERRKEGTPEFQKAVHEILANRKLRKLWQNKLKISWERENLPKEKWKVQYLKAGKENEKDGTIERMGPKNQPTGSKHSSGRWDIITKNEVGLEGQPGEFSCGKGGKNPDKDHSLDRNREDCTGEWWR